ncbi:hypothetical protein H9P43_004170 [Blastocladiella emersonii ATCC 22665]|nr:hypothetical protein H9P43_004170 [Blastocladiella emersonii ATCC 22665]
MASKAVAPRYGHSGLVAGTQLYLIGGRTGAAAISEVLRVDLAKSWPVSSPAYSMRAADNAAPSGLSGSGCRSLAKDHVRCLGGVETSGTLGSGMLDLIYSDATGKWTAGTSTAPASGGPGPRIGHGVAYANGGYYVFGGSKTASNTVLGVPGPGTNELWKLDLATNAWTQYAVSGGPPGLTQFTFTALRENQNLLTVVGGVRADGTLHPMNEVWVYNVSNNSWKLYQATGVPPVARRGHATCSIGNFVYMFGGTNTDNSAFYADMSALVFDKEKDSFTWNPVYRPAAANYDANRADAAVYPVGRAFHQLTCAARHVFVSFGYSSLQVRDVADLGMAVFDGAAGANPIAAMHLYDFSSITEATTGWTAQYSPPDASLIFGDVVPTVALPNGTAGGNATTFWTVPVIVGIACAGVALLMAAALVAWYCRNRSRKAKDNRRLSDAVSAARFRTTNASANNNVGAASTKVNVAATSPQLGSNGPQFGLSGPTAPLAAAASSAGTMGASTLASGGAGVAHNMYSQPQQQQAPAQLDYGYDAYQMDMADPYQQQQQAQPMQQQRPNSAGHPTMTTPATNLNILYMGPAKSHPPVVTTRPVIPVIHRDSASVSDYGAGSAAAGVDAEAASSSGNNANRMSRMSGYTTRSTASDAVASNSAAGAGITRPGSAGAQQYHQQHTLATTSTIVTSPVITTSAVTTSKTTTVVTSPVTPRAQNASVHTASSDELYLPAETLIRRDAAANGSPSVHSYTSAPMPAGAAGSGVVAASTVTVHQPSAQQLQQPRRASVSSIGSIESGVQFA